MGKRTLIFKSPKYIHYLVCFYSFFCSNLPILHSDRADRKVGRNLIRKLLNLRISRVCKPKRLRCRQNYPYRSADGTCNNLRKPYQGAARTTFRSLFPPVYDNGYNSPRTRSAVDPQLELPNARLISTTIHPDLEHPDPSVTNMVPQIGQVSFFNPIENQMNTLS